MSAAMLDASPSRRAASPPPPQRPALAHGPRESRRLAYILASLFALLVHGGIFHFLRSGESTGPEFAVSAGDSSVEVTLVAAPPAPEPVAEPVAEAPVEPVTEPPPVEPPPVEPPPPVAPETPPVPAEPPPPEAIVEPTPPPPAEVLPPPKPQPPKAAPKKTAVRKPAPRPSTTAPKAVGDGSSATPGLDATTSRSTNGDRATPGYLRNPNPAYPEESRRARHEGTVRLRVRVSAEGAPASVTLFRSSGFPLLDERALSTVRDRWSFKPARVGGVNVPGELIIPVRFSLHD